MTHVENIPHILQYGITHKNSLNCNHNFINIGDISLIDTRNNKKVWVDNGDFSNLNAPTIVLGEFIPFYFGVKMPMLYVIQNGGNFVEKATPAEEIIYLACPISKIIKSQSIYYFTDGHATDNLTSFYDRTKISELPTIIDWNAIKAAYWGGSENLNIKRKKQAEFLVSNDLPSDYLMGYGCYNESTRRKLIEMGVANEKIKVIPNAYY
jgi:hypothetical protein